ncbi:hypothetical protein [Senegalia massiliensis]|uniref:hypothetical protein n=1 Tax=Senegalia massiliensis TaxID=1720316 RepID=UPI0013EF0A44|nr:hypothetical protein [Senegalia massiliensis]
MQSENTCYICQDNPLDKELIYDVKIKQCYHMECLKEQSIKKIQNAITSVDDI